MITSVNKEGKLVFRSKISNVKDNLKIYLKLGISITMELNNFSELIHTCNDIEFTAIGECTTGESTPTISHLSLFNPSPAFPGLGYLPETWVLWQCSPGFLQTSCILKVTEMIKDDKTSIMVITLHPNLACPQFQLSQSVNQVFFLADFTAHWHKIDCLKLCFTAWSWRMGKEEETI